MLINVFGCFNLKKICRKNNYLIYKMELSIIYFVILSQLITN